jgi:hypothetical protein
MIDFKRQKNINALCKKSIHKSKKTKKLQSDNFVVFIIPTVTNHLASKNITTKPLSTIQNKPIATY